jgi:hypothetical protein
MDLTVAREQQRQNAPHERLRRITNHANIAMRYM